jgi:hypothetical protein
MELIIPDAIAEKIWSKDNRKISREDVQAAWQTFLNSQEHDTVLDTREEHDTWPPTEWILVRQRRHILKLVFIIDETDDTAYLKTAFFVDQRTIKAYTDLGGIIYG